MAERLDRVLIEPNNRIIDELESGYNRFMFATIEDSIARLRRENATYEALKTLDSERFLRKIPKSAFVYTARERIKPEILNKNIEALNKMDERLLNKLEFGLLHIILRKPNLEEKLCLLSVADDKILEVMSKSAVTDFISDTNICSNTDQDIELFKKIYEAAKYGDFSSVSLDDARAAKVIRFEKTDNKED